VDLRLQGYFELPAGRRPVSSAYRSIVLHCQIEDRPSLPNGFGNPGPDARTFTRWGDSPSRFAMSTAMTSSVRESTRILPTYLRELI